MLNYSDPVLFRVTSPFPGVDLDVLSPSKTPHLKHVAAARMIESMYIPEICMIGSDLSRFKTEMCNGWRVLYV